MIFFNKNNKISPLKARTLALDNANKRLIYVKNQQNLQNQQLKNNKIKTSLLNKSTLMHINRKIINAYTSQSKTISKTDQLYKIEEAWKKQMLLNNKQPENKVQQSVIDKKSNLNSLSNKQLIIPPYKGKSNIDNISAGDTIQKNEKKIYSKNELQDLVDIANNGKGEEKEIAINKLKEIIQQNTKNESSSPTLIHPMQKQSSQITELIKKTNLMSEYRPISSELNDIILKRLITEVYNEKQFEYQKFIDCIYNISNEHKNNPVLIPILNKALGRINRMSIIKLPDDLMGKFIHIVLEELWPDIFKNK